MRMRKKKHGAERIEACGEYLLKTKEEIEEFLMKNGEKRRCLLEIGCGKGSFALAASSRWREYPFLALERFSDVALLALEKAKGAGADPAGLRFLIADAKTLPELLHEGSVERIYLNFSDPWPKKGYAKRRLTHRGFLEMYKKLLRPGGRICFKTDNEALFSFSLEEFAATGYRVEKVTDDLHTSPLNAENIPTEYEKNFSEKGFPIHYCEAVCEVTPSEKADLPENGGEAPR